MTERSADLQLFLDQHPTFGQWTESWDGVPLEFRVGLSSTLPPAPFLASVRAIVLKGHQVLVVRSDVPILTVGGRIEAGETPEQALVREVAEETGWTCQVLGHIGFIHVRHLDPQRPAWGRPAPDFVDLIYVVSAQAHHPEWQEEHAPESKFFSLREIEQLGLHKYDLIFLRAAWQRVQQKRGRGN